MQKASKALILQLKQYSGVRPKWLRIMYHFADIPMFCSGHAECEAQIGSLDQAETYVNMVRTRAANPAGFVYLNANYDGTTSMYTPQTTPADKYKVSPLSPVLLRATGKDRCLMPFTLKEDWSSPWKASVSSTWPDMTMAPALWQLH